jgi:DNA-directed RNA polymerase subunit beta'
VEELFEARKPKHLAILAEIAGEVSIGEVKKSRQITIFNKETGEEKVYPVAYGSRIKVTDGQYVEPGDELTEGSVNPHDILAVKDAKSVEPTSSRKCSGCTACRAWTSKTSTSRSSCAR